MFAFLGDAVQKLSECYVCLFAAEKFDELIFIQLWTLSVGWIVTQHLSEEFAQMIRRHILVVLRKELAHDFQVDETFSVKVKLLENLLSIIGCHSSSRAHSVAK